MHALMVEDGGTIPPAEVWNMHVLMVEDDGIYRASGGKGGGNCHKRGLMKSRVFGGGVETCMLCWWRMAAQFLRGKF